MKKNILLAGLLIILAILFLVANAPAPWWACEDLAEGDLCERYTGPGCGSGCNVGRCQLVDNCTDDPSTEVNECMYCLEM